jgi:predicted enzyme related to lactoylglutathione lyase
MAYTYAPGTPSWVDLGTTDVTSASSFYGQLFGWQVQDLGPDAGGYGMLLKDGKQVGGIGPATDPGRGSSWSVYFATDDADNSAARVQDAGGTVVAPPMDVMGQGRTAVFQDPTGAYFSVWQPGQLRGAELTEAPGSVSWVELMSSDVFHAKAFYQDVLGVATRDVDVGGGMYYTLLETASKNVAGAMPMSAGQQQPSHWGVYFAVEDCDAVADRAIQMGATEMHRDDSPAGRLAFLVDPQGAQFSIIKPEPNFSM